MTDLRELEKRLEEATGPDRELDVALSQMGYDMSEYVAQRRVGYFVHKDCLDNPDKGEWDVAHFTASLDAAVALVERVLPSNRDDGRVWLQLLDDAVTTALASDAKPEDMARLVCITLIRTLIAKGDRHD